MSHFAISSFGITEESQDTIVTVESHEDTLLFRIGQTDIVEDFDFCQDVVLRSLRLKWSEDNYSFVPPFSRTVDIICFNVGFLTYILKKRVEKFSCGIQRIDETIARYIKIQMVTVAFFGNGCEEKEIWIDRARNGLLPGALWDDEDDYTTLSHTISVIE